MADDAGFFARWAQRKAAVRQGLPLPPQPAPAASDAARAPAVPAAPAQAPAQAFALACLDERGALVLQDDAAAATEATTSESLTAAPTEALTEQPTKPPAKPPTEPPPTLAEAQALTPSADFRRFVAPGVDSQIKNAALKQLFTDPHFNVMDGLDTYIDDYGKPDPLPASMLRRMVQAKALGLFTDDPPAQAPTAVQAAGSQGVAGAASAASRPAQGADATPVEPAIDTLTEAGPEGLASNPIELHENADLRLQPDDAAGRPGPEPGTERDAGRAG